MKADDPVQRVQQLALLKGRGVHFEHDNDIILAADTSVVFNNEILGKPKDRKKAYHMINLLSEEKHYVYTGIVIRSAQKEVVFVKKTEVEFWPIETKEIEQYILTEEPYDKTGGYGIQGKGALFVKQIVGDYYNVVGLPLSRVVRKLRDFGIG